MSGAGSVDRARIPRDTYYRDVNLRRISHMRQAHECTEAGKARSSISQDGPMLMRTHGSLLSAISNAAATGIARYLTPALNRDADHIYIRSDAPGRVGASCFSVLAWLSIRGSERGRCRFVTIDLAAIREGRHAAPVQRAAFGGRAVKLRRGRQCALRQTAVHAASPSALRPRMRRHQSAPYPWR
jgi:hypothetical protein